MSSLGFQTIYRMLNERPDIVCERAFWQRRFAADDPVVSIETQRALAEFAVIAFSVSYEMDYPHLVEILRQAGIPLRADERDASWPAVVVGGPAVSANPLPIADFCDVVIVGEAEELLDDLVECLWAGLNRPRHRLWEALTALPGAFVPQIPGPVDRQWVRDLDPYPTATAVHTPNTEFAKMHLIEISRGCGRGCRFCMAGFTCRPKREHSIDSILAQAEQGLAYRDRIGLVGAAVSDYGDIDILARRLRDIGARLSVSSLRVDPLSDPLLQALAESGVQTLTIAPEAGSERLRRAINKSVTSDHILHAAQRAAHHRFAQLKLYFMLGLPGETEQDVQAIVTLCREVAARFDGRVTANVTPFVPKAHTPFQWAAMTPVDTLESRLDTLQRQLKPERIDIRGESPQWAAIQAMLARGDRRLGQVLISLQGRSIRHWERAMSACGISAEDYITARRNSDPLPWDFIQTGIRPVYLKKEWERAKANAPTTHCRPEICEQCDVCSNQTR
jgi:radical SAM superfamily enzyme YgiQ (UPF0313 family)